MATMSERISDKRYQWKQKRREHYNPERQQDNYTARINSYLKKDQFLLAGLKLLDMAKDFFDTTRRYKSRHHVLRDAAQILHGLVNLVIKPLVLVAMALFFALIAPFYTLYKKWGDGNTTGLEILKNSFYAAAGFLAHAFTSAIRGITQLAAAPLTWLRMIARSVYTAVKGWQPFTENIGVKAVISGDDTAVIFDDEGSPDEIGLMQHISWELQAKLKKAVSQGQPIDMNTSHEHWKMNAEVENGNHIDPHKIYLKTTGEKSFSYITTKTGDPNNALSQPKLIAVNLEDLMPSFKEKFDSNNAKHTQLVWDIVIRNGHIDPADAVIQIKEDLYDYFDEVAQNADNPDNVITHFNEIGLGLARDYLSLFGAKSVQPAEPRTAYQWDAERNLRYL